MVSMSFTLVSGTYIVASKRCILVSAPKLFDELNIYHGERAIYFNKQNIHCTGQKGYFGELTKTFGELWKT